MTRTPLAELPVLALGSTRRPSELMAGQAGTVAEVPVESGCTVRSERPSAVIAAGGDR